jgi:hypothetical protein
MRPRTLGAGIARRSRRSAFRTLQRNRRCIDGEIRWAAAAQLPCRCD